MISSVENKIVLGFVASVLALVGIGLLSYYTTKNLVGAEVWVNHTYQVIASIESGRAILIDAETAQRGYLLTGDDVFLKDSTNARAQVNAWVEKLRSDVSDNPEPLQRLDKLQPLISKRLAMLNDRINLRRERGLQAVISAVSTHAGKELMDRIQRGISEMHEAENQLAYQRLKAAQTSAAMAEVVIVGSSAFACAVGVVAIFFIRRDLKLREQTGRELQESRAQLQSILDNMPAIIFLKDIEGRYLFVNRQYQKIYGFSGNDAIGKTVFDIIPREQANIAHGHHQKILSTQSALELEETLMYSGGTHTHFVVKFPIRDKAGKIYATGGISTDITESKRAQEELDRFFALSLDFLCIASADGYFKRVSPAVTDILGWNVEEFLSRPYINFVHPDDQDATLREVERQVNTGEKVLHFENRYQHKNGSWRVLSWRSIPQPGGLMYATARDVTAERATQNALRESEARYRTLFDSIDEGFCIIQMIFDDQQKPVDYRFLEINPSFEKQTGLCNAIGKTMRELAPQHETHWFEIYGRIAVTGEVARFQNRAEQLYRTYDVYAFRFGEPVNRQVAILFKDITKSKEAEQEIIRQKEELQATNKELEAFSYSVSHDLRAPLRHVDGFVDLLRKQSAEKLDDRGRRYLNIIADSARRMGVLIDDLLVFSRMSRTDLRHAKVASESLAHEVWDALQVEINGRDVVFKIDNLPQIEADASMLRQVLANLIGNAVKYSRTRSPAEIEIGCNEENGEFVFHVRDNGVGFDMQYAHKLFGVFQRLHRADEFEGTGIGLANVRRIISRHGGRTWAEGKLDGGATFFFSLPKIPTEMKG